MKIEIKENEHLEEIDFPRLMKAKGSGVIVYFYNSKQGVALISAGIYKKGHYSNNWDMDHFTDFEGSITLSND